jgi:hypothetical protein
MLLSLRTWQAHLAGMLVLLVLLVVLVLLVALVALVVQAQLSHLEGLTHRPVVADSAPE